MQRACGATPMCSMSRVARPRDRPARLGGLPSRIRSVTSRPIPAPALRENEKPAYWLERIGIGGDRWPEWKRPMRCKVRLLVRLGIRERHIPRRWIGEFCRNVEHEHRPGAARWKTRAGPQRGSVPMRLVACGGHLLLGWIWWHEKPVTGAPEGRIVSAGPVSRCGVRRQREDDSGMLAGRHVDRSRGAVMDRDLDPDLDL